MRFKSVMLASEVAYWVEKLPRTNKVLDLTPDQTFL